MSLYVTNVLMIIVSELVIKETSETGMIQKHTGNRFAPDYKQKETS